MNYHRSGGHAVWVAELDCLHSVDVEQALSFSTEIDCGQCAALQLPEGLTEYKRTAEFTTTTVPAGLLRHHTTKAGIWGRLHVVEGRVHYQPDGLPAQDVRGGEHANIPPLLPHSIQPDVGARFYVAFYRRDPQ